MIISISGMDGLGKSTQANILAQRMPQYFTKPLHINQSPSFPKLGKEQLAEWWFNPNNKEEFVDAMFAALAERMALARQISKTGKIVVLDKGYDFYLTRIKATLLSYGTPVEQVEQLMLDAIKKYNLDKKQEDIKFIITPPEDYKGIKRPEEQFKQTEDIYEKYSAINIELLNKKLNETKVFVPVEYVKNDPEKMTQNILRVINSHKQNPLIHQDIVFSVVKNAKQMFDDNLKMVILAGSSVKGHFIENWSDLDFYFILKDLNNKQISDFTKSVGKMPIHIGTTFYTMSDLTPPLRVDKRTMVTFYEINIGKNKILYNPENLEVPYITFDQISQTEQSNIAEVLNEVKRQVFFDDFDAKKFIKKVTILQKVVLRSKGILTETYTDTMKLFSQIYNIPYINIPKLVQKDLKDPKIIKKLKNYGQSVIECLEKEKKDNIVETEREVNQQWKEKVAEQ